MAMHYGTGALVGALRGIMAGANLRGPRASLMHTAIRLNVDQIAIGGGNGPAQDGGRPVLARTFLGFRCGNVVRTTG